MNDTALGRKFKSADVTAVPPCPDGLLAAADFTVLFLAEPVSWQLLAAALLMVLGIWLNLTGHHVHAHRHEVLEHEHLHTHPTDDGHHQHAREPAFEGRHAHRHPHEPQQHSHAYFPDAHHRRRGHKH